MILNRKKYDKDTKYTNENSSIMLKMVTSYSIFLLIILVLFFVIYQSTLNNTRNSYNSQNETSFISNAELFETDLHIMEVYCRQLLQEKNFRKIMNMEEADTKFIETAYKLRDTLATDIYLENLLPIKDTFCYFHLTDYIMTPSILTLRNRYYEFLQKYPLEDQEAWISYHTNSLYHNRFLFMENFSELPGTDWDFYMYIINMNDLFYMNANATVTFIFDANKLRELFECLRTEQNGFLLIVDEEERTILSINEDYAYNSGAILALDYTDNFSSYESKEGNITIGRYVSDNTGYVYYYSFPAFETTTNTGSMQWMFALTFLLTILTGGAIIFYFVRRNVRPIIELGQELHEAVEAQNYLQEVVDNQRPIICTSYVRQLMSGTVTSEEEASYIHNYLELGNSSYYNVLYVVVYNNSYDSNGNLPEDRDTPEELQEIIATALRNFLGAPIYYFSPAERTYSVLLHCDEETEKDFILKISNMVSRLHDYMLDTYDIWLFAGIGRNTDSLLNVWESYQQATDAVSYTTKNYIFYPYEFIKKSSKVFYYPTEISTRLIHFISSGNRAQVLELFNLIHQENIEERSLPINLLKYLLSDIRNTLLKARFTLPSDADPETVKLLDERFNEHLTFKLCEDLALTLCNLFTSEAKDENLAVTIEKYIQANFKDPSLCLNKISDEFQISESYFSHMFKEKTGANFSTYLENLRLNEAMRLIKETDISLNELYLAVGYNNPTTFRRAFKKVFGVTPSSVK